MPPLGGSLYRDQKGRMYLEGSNSLAASSVDLMTECSSQGDRPERSFCLPDPSSNEDGQDRLEVLSAYFRLLAEGATRQASKACFNDRVETETFDETDSQSSGEQVSHHSNDATSIKAVKNFRFSEENEYLDPPPRMSADEKALCFYNATDQEQFDMDRVVVATAYEIRKKNGLGWFDVQDTVRGLEDYFLEIPKMLMRRAHVERVLSEQQRQRDLEVSDEEGLADVARESSSRSRSTAAAVGVNDTHASNGEYIFRP